MTHTVVGSRYSCNCYGIPSGQAFSDAQVQRRGVPQPNPFDNSAVEKKKKEKKRWNWQSKGNAD